MTYKVEISPGARRSLKKLPPEILKRVDDRILSLADNPRPPGAEKLVGEELTYRVRVGAYRILYEVHDDVLVILVVRIGHRKEIYRKN